MIRLFTCLTIILLSETKFVLGSCTSEISHATWKYHYGSDEEIIGVDTVKDCKELCLNDPVNCRGYTHTSNGVVGYCYKFKKLEGMHACATCSSGTNPDFIEDGACPFNIEYELGEEYAESVEVCWQKCYERTGCTAFTWFNSSTPFQNICFLFSSCEDLVPCTGCKSGKVSCISMPQCYQYNILDEASRNVHAHSEGNFYHGDFYKSLRQSPMWVGSGYYRMMPPAGTIIPEYSVAANYCGTVYGGYLPEGSHPEQVGVEVNRTVHYSELSGAADIRITKCPGNYYVYYLPDSTHKDKRYCADNQE